MKGVENKDYVLKRFANLQDTMIHLKRIAKQYSYQVRDLARELKQDTELETIKAIWHWVRTNIDYELDEKGIEQLRRPARILSDKKGDCDCLTILILALLIESNISCKAKITAYPKRDKHTGQFKTDLRGNYISADYSHIYPIATDKNGIEYVLDTVPEIKGFNQEAEPITKYKILKIMELHELAGVETDTASNVDDVINDVVEIQKQELQGIDNDIVEDVNLDNEIQNELDFIDDNVLLSGNLAIVSEDDEQAVAIPESTLIMRMIKASVMRERDRLAEELEKKTLLSKIGNINEELEIFETVVDADDLEDALFVASNSNSKFKNYFKGLYENIVSIKMNSGLSGSEDVYYIRDTSKMTEEEISHLYGLGSWASRQRDKARARARALAKKYRSRIKKVAKKAVHSIKRYSPTTVSLRASAIVAIRTNMFHMADKLAYGYLTLSQAKQNNLDLGEWKKFVSARKKVESAYVKAGGTRTAIKNAVKKLKIAKKIGLHGIYGADEDFDYTQEILEELQGLGIVPAIAGIVKIIVSILGSINFKKLFKRKSKGGTSAPNQRNAGHQPPQQQQAQPPKGTEGGKGHDVPAVSFKDKIKQTYVDNKKGFLYGGIAVAVLVIGIVLYFIFKPKKKATPVRRKRRTKALNGVTTTRTRAKRKTTAKPKTSGNSKLKALHRKARALRKKHPKMKYSTALKRVSKK